jgi:hypothetical protein
MINGQFFSIINNTLLQHTPPNTMPNTIPKNAWEFFSNSAMSFFRLGKSRSSPPHG